MGNGAIETRPCKKARGLLIITKHQTTYWKCTEAKPESEKLKIQDSTIDYDDRALRNEDLHQCQLQRKSNYGATMNESSEEFSANIGILLLKQDNNQSEE